MRNILLVAVILTVLFVPQISYADKADKYVEEYAEYIGVSQAVDNNVAVTYTGNHWKQDGVTYYEYKAKIDQAPIYNDDGTPVSCSFRYTAPQPIYDEPKNENQQPKVLSYTQGYYEITDNVFYVKVEGTRVTTSYEGETSVYDPVVMIDNKEHTAKSQTLVPVDPINSYYKNNTLVWDYGVCKRNLRVIEGLISETWVFDKDPKGNVWIKDNAVQSQGYDYSIEPYAYDADGNVLPVNQYKQLAASVMAGAVYPVTIDPTDVFTTSASDGFLYYTDAVYATAHDAANAETLDSTSAYLRLGQSKPSSYYLFRSYLYFDTSALPDSGTISAANLSLYGKNDLSTTDFNIVVQDGQPTYPHDPLQVGDWDYTKYSGAGSAFSTAWFSTAGYNNISLTAAGLTYISVSGTTKLCIRSSRDISDTAPTGSEYVDIYSYEKGAGYRPTLYVTYSSSGPPTVTTNPETYVTTTGARLNGYLDADGGEANNVRFEYIPWYNASWTAAFAVTVNAAVVDSDLTNFPVLVTGDDCPDDFWTLVNASGADIVVTNSSHPLAVMPRELVSIDTVAETMELYFNASTIDDTDNTTFYVWYGNPTAVLTNDTDTWDANYVAVYHMNDDPDNAHVQDSTVNNEDGTKKGANEPIEADGNFDGDKAQDFDATDDYISVSDSVSLQNIFDSGGTVETILQLNNDGEGDNGTVLNKQVTTGWKLRVYDQIGSYMRPRFLLTFTGTDFDTAGNRLLPLIYSSYSLTYNDSSNTSVALMYLNGNSLSCNDPSNTGTRDSDVGKDLIIGAASNAGALVLDGNISEVRISNISRSAAWIKATYYSLMTSATFYEVDADEAFTITANQSKNTGDSWYNDITGLEKNNLYGYRAVATNSLGTDFGAWEIIDTTVVLEEPTNVTCNPSSNSITLSWVKGGNTSSTYIRYNTGTYPANTADGHALPLQNGVDYVHTGLTSGVTYYYKMWGEDGGLYSATNSTTVCTTQAGFATSTPVPLPSVNTSGWSETPNGSVLTNNPLYALGNLEAAEVGVPQNTWWMLIGLGILVSGGIFIYTRSRNLLAALGGMIIFGVIMAQMGLFPIWTMIIFGLTGIGFGWKEIR